MTYEDLSKEFPTLIKQACCFLGHDTPTMPTPPLQKQFNPLKNDLTDGLKRSQTNEKVNL